MHKAFSDGIEDLRRAMDYHIRKGLGKAALALMADAVMEAPSVPLEEGSLRGSASAFVGNELIATSNDPKSGIDVRMKPGAHLSPATSLSVPTAKGKITATVGFNTPYASRLHEHPEYEFTEPGSGGKFLENKLNANRDKYIEVVVEVIRQEVFNNTL